MAVTRGMDCATNDLYYLLMPERGLVFVHFAHFPRCQAVVDKQFEGYASLQLMTRGRLEVHYGESGWTLAGEWFWPHYPGPHIRVQRAPTCRHWNHRYVAVRGMLVQQWIEEGLMRFEPQPARPIERAVERFDRLLDLAKSPERWARLRAINQLEGLLLDLAAARQAHQPAGLVEQVDRWMDVQPTLWPDYHALAEELGMGLSTLRRHFHRAASQSLHEYVLNRRITSASQLLLETDLNIKQIAQQLGYSDVFFFSRQFALRTGLPPAEFRRVRRSPPVG